MWNAPRLASPIMPGLRWPTRSWSFYKLPAHAKTAKLRHNNGLSFHRCFEPAGLFRAKDTEVCVNDPIGALGARKQPYYRVVVIEKEHARNGRPVEVVGTYNPRTNPATCDLKREAIEHWVSKGAQCFGPRQETACTARTGGSRFGRLAVLNHRQPSGAVVNNDRACRQSARHD